MLHASPLSSSIPKRLRPSKPSGVTTAFQSRGRPAAMPKLNTTSSKRTTAATQRYLSTNVLPPPSKTPASHRDHLQDDDVEVLERTGVSVKLMTSHKVRQNLVYVICVEDCRRCYVSRECWLCNILTNCSFPGLGTQGSPIPRSSTPGQGSSSTKTKVHK